MKPKNTAGGIEGRVQVVEDTIHATNHRLDGFGNELKILLAEVTVISDWISERFGVELIDKSSFLFKNIHNYEEVEEIASNISSLYSANKISKPSEARESNRKRKKQNCKGESGSADNHEDSDMNGSPVKRKRGRPKKNNEDTEEVIIKKRGRPRKSKTEQAQVNEERVQRPETEDQVAENSTEDTFKGGIYSTRLVGIRKELPNQDVAATATPLQNPSNYPNRERDQAQCDFCGKILKDASSLRQHKLIHRNLRPHPCPVCGKCFRRKFHLKTHLLIHSGEKKHQCGYCGKLFLLTKDLIAHERIHTGEKPYSCNICTKSFNLKSHLTMHLRIHTGEKPYKCNICENCFSQSNSLRVHKKVHLKNKNSSGFESSSIHPNEQNKNCQYIIPEQIDLKIHAHPCPTNGDEISSNSSQSDATFMNDSNLFPRSQSNMLINSSEKSDDYNGGDGPISIGQSLSFSLSSADHPPVQQRSTLGSQSILFPSTTSGVIIGVQSIYGGIDQHSYRSQNVAPQTIGIADGSLNLDASTIQTFMTSSASFASIQQLQDPKTSYF